MTKQIFQLQVYCARTHREEHPKALIDPNLTGLFRRIIRGQHDCYICRRTLDLDPVSDTSPGLICYAHGDRPQVVGMAACRACAVKLGNEQTARMIGEMFVDECCCGGTVELVQGGNA